MDCISSIKTTQALPAEVKSQRRKGYQVSSASVVFSNSSRKSSFQKAFHNPKSGLNIYTRRSSQPLIVAVSKTESKGFKNSGVRTPLEPSSPEGRFLSLILQNHRHLFLFSVEQQLDEMSSTRDEAAEQKIENLSSMESVLHKRIAEMKEKERQSAVEDVIYMLIAHKFSETGAPMVSKLSESITGNRLDIPPSNCRELESIHSLEVQEHIREHVTTVLRMRRKSVLANNLTSSKINRLDLGRIYAASVMYGYFLKSAAFRRQMDTSLVSTHIPLHGYSNTYSVADSYLHLHGFQTLGETTDTQILELCHELHMTDTRAENLRSYVMGFDAQTLQRCAKLNSQEVVNVIEKHTWALFGDDDITGEHEIVITFSSLERLVLEAAAFGSFLWDVERLVDSRYTLKKN